MINARISEMEIGELEVHIVCFGMYRALSIMHDYHDLNALVAQDNKEDFLGKMVYVVIDSEVEIHEVH